MEHDESVFSDRLKMGDLEFLRSLALDFSTLEHGGIGSTTDAVPLPKLKPRAMREHLVVPSIRCREVARAEWSNVRGFEHFL